MVKVIWRGSWYKRSDGSLRQTGTGIIAGKVQVIKRKGNDRIIIKNGQNIKGVEEVSGNFYGPDKPPVLKKVPQARLKKIRTKVRENNPNARKRRSSHMRNLK